MESLRQQLTRKDYQVAPCHAHDEEEDDAANDGDDAANDVDDGDDGH